MLALACWYVVRWASKNIRTDFKIAFGLTAWDSPQFDVDLLFPDHLNEDADGGRLHVALYKAKRLIEEKKFTIDHSITRGLW
jgi:hypothetical protein